jgi:hypothetical protein
MSLRIHRQIGPTRKVLPEQTIGVLIGPPAEDRKPSQGLNAETARRGCSSDLAPKFYPAVSSLLAFGLPLFGGGSDGSWRGALGIAQRQIPARMEGEGVLGRCLPSELRMGA